MKEIKRLLVLQHLEIEGPGLFEQFAKERDFIKKELENERPIVGVCLGAQLLASAAGGGVEILKCGSPPKALPEIGWSQIFIDKSNKEFKSLFESPFHVLHWHGDRILLPNKAVLIASSARCKEQFFRLSLIHI